MLQYALQNNFKVFQVVVYLVVVVFSSYSIN